MVAGTMPQAALGYAQLFAGAAWARYASGTSPERVVRKPPEQTVPEQTVTARSLPPRAQHKVVVHPLEPKRQ
jgi:hypothetical protein